LVLESSFPKHTCPFGLISLANSCYYIGNITKNWNDSKTFCEQQNFHLMTIKTQDEFNLLSNLSKFLGNTRFWVTVYK
jgi:hypothetical protein